MIVQPSSFAPADTTALPPAPPPPATAAGWLIGSQAAVSLTKLTQMAGQSLLTARERISRDLRDVANQTLLLDIRILSATVATVVLCRGAF